MQGLYHLPALYGLGHGVPGDDSFCRCFASGRTACWQHPFHQRRTRFGLQTTHFLISKPQVRLRFYRRLPFDPMDYPSVILENYVNHFFKIALGVLLGLCAVTSQAGPMGFKDSSMAMGDFSANWQEAWVNHAVTPRDAWGLGAVWMRSDDLRLTRSLAEATYTRLAKRWNGEHSQANIWLLAGVGALRGSDFSDSRLMVAPGISADYETARIYVSGTLRLYRAPGINHDYASMRAGFSFYETDYDEVQPWLVLEARRMNNLSDQTEITPMLRFIHSRYFVEIGMNQANQGRFNFMYIF